MPTHQPSRRSLGYWSTLSWLIDSSTDALWIEHQQYGRQPFHLRWVLVSVGLGFARAQFLWGARISEMTRRTRHRPASGLLPVTVASLLVSCGGDQARGRNDAGGGIDAAVGGAAVDANVDAHVACWSTPDAIEPEVPGFVPFEGGVPLKQVAHALAVARCTYWARCFPVAPYVLDECINALSEAQSWNIVTCPRNDVCVGARIGIGFPSAALFQAVEAGLVNYDPERESACLQALQVQGCHGSDVWEGIAPCGNVFTCAVDAGTGSDEADGGGTADGGGPCSGLFLGPTLENARPACSGTGDCTAAKPPAGPYCVDGYCAPSPCGDDYFSCPTADLGQPCDAYPVIFGSSRAMPGGGMPTRSCTPGLLCTGLSKTGPGICAYPQDIGGTCQQDTAITGCGVGLTCQCGTCQLPPDHGPCVSDTCLVGAAFCENKSNTCIPVRQLGEDCSDGQVCAPNLDCNSDTCEY